MERWAKHTKALHVLDQQSLLLHPIMQVIVFIFITKITIINSNILVKMNAAKYKSIEAASPSLTVPLNL